MSTVPASEVRTWIRTSEAARLLGVSEQTMRRRASNFGVRVKRLHGTAIRLFRLADVMRARQELEDVDDVEPKKGTVRAAR